MAGLPMAMNQSCYALVSKKNECCQFFVFLLTKSIADRLMQQSHGTVFETITTETFQRTFIAMPNQQILLAFTEKIRPIYDTLNFIQLIVKTVMYFNPLKVFVPVSIFLFLSGITVFLYSKLFLIKVLDITTIILILSSIQILAIGMIADAIIKRTQ